MATVSQTKIKIANVNEVVTMSGDRSAADVKAQFQDFYPSLANSVFTETVVAGVKTITFTEQVGTKGC